ncbi:hypothetical protein HUG15_15865 [Salicibibacter cibarius]|uniref:Uncharacterized protein n=1 Tax=Salicibibacter cibarius TaxID=2743000 RepID=A0A7T6Z4Y7_9BACI|nr:UPF0158 family protein [Salicibibacter cibarius]QQK76897.1 hypothetical protein HUG15_15865 [Salicibibacter cibarius]
MNKPVDLSEVAEAIDFDADELYQFVNRKTGEIVVVNESTMRKANREEPFDEKHEWQKEERALAEDIIDNEDDYEPIPESYEVNDYQLMEIFIDSLSDEKKQATLTEAIRGKGAFRRFKDRIVDLNVEDDWHEFKEKEYLAFACRWCEENGIAYNE